MAKKRAKAAPIGAPVLPPIERKEALDVPADPDDLLTKEQRLELKAALERMATLRREAEVSSANLKMA